MTGDQRAVRQAEIEAAVAVLVEHGWSVERLCYTDETGEPYRAEIALRVDGSTFSGVI